MPEELIGFISHYFDKANVAAIQITNGNLAIGDTIHIKGHTTDMNTTIESMQIEHETIQKAKKGDGVGIKVPEHVREHDQVFKVTQ